MADYSLPPDFAEQLERVLAAGESAAAAAVITDALSLPDEALGEFLESLAFRVASSARPVTAPELRELLVGARASRSASQRSSQ